MILAALLILAPLLLLAGRTLTDLVDERRALRAELEARERDEWAAFRLAFETARPERVAPGRRRRPVFYPVACGD